MNVSIIRGEVYIVATPIGNLKDITLRALEVLKAVDLVLVEDTRRARRLFNHFGIDTAMFALHDHNETELIPEVLSRVNNGASIALISDAGTPLISDPGYPLVRALHQSGVRVYPVPGACALVAALSVSGLPTDGFIFEGFLPSRGQARRTRLSTLISEPRTIVFFEAPHRILVSLEDMRLIFGCDRQIMLGREMTKRFETYRLGTLSTLTDWISGDNNQRKGEFVIIVAGREMSPAPKDSDLLLLQALLEELPVTRAVAVATRVTGTSKNQLYKLALSIVD